MQKVLILNNIRSSENVGSIFRTADAAGIYKIYLCGYTPAPVDKFGRTNRALSKAALGAEKFVEWEKVKNLKTIISNLKTKKHKIIGVEQSPKSKNYKLLSTNYNLAFIFGNEVSGLSKNDLSFCDTIIEIPMRGRKESLNVAVAAGIILFNN